MARKIRQRVNVVIVNHDGNATEEHVFAAHQRRGMINLQVRFEEEGVPVEVPMLFSVKEVHVHTGPDMQEVLVISGGLFTFENPSHLIGNASGTYHRKMKTGQLIADIYDD